MTDPLYPDWHGNLDKTAIMERYALALAKKDAIISRYENALKCIERKGERFSGQYAAEVLAEGRKP